MLVFVEVFKKKKKEQCFIHLRQLTTNHDIIKSKNMYYGSFVRTLHTYISDIVNIYFLYRGTRFYNFFI